jgi:hypothetical protein
MTGRVGTLAGALNAVFGLNLADIAEACAWLASGGWEQLDAWLHPVGVGGQEDAPGADSGGEEED